MRLRVSTTILASSVGLAGLVGCGAAQHGAGTPSSGTQSPTAPPVPTSAGSRDLRQGRDAYRAGRFEEAAQAWQRAAASDREASQPGPEADALVDLASAYEMLGQYDLAKARLDEAVAIAEKLHDSRRKIAALDGLGVACTLKPDPEPESGMQARQTQQGGTAPGTTQPNTTVPAEDHGSHDPGPATSPAPAGHVHGASGSRRRDARVILERALALASETGDRSAEASVCDNLGNCLSDRKQFDEALGYYDRCVRLSEDSGDSLRAARASANAGACALTASRAADAEAIKAANSTKRRERDTAAAKRQRSAELRQQAADWDGRAWGKLESLPASHAKAFLLNLVGQTDQHVAAGAGPRPGAIDPAALVDRARRAYQSAADVATTIDDPRSLSYAFGYLAHLDERDAEAEADRGKREQAIESALALTRRAVFAAQRAQAADALYLWQWQAGRLLAALGELPEAIASCQRAVQTLKGIRPDIALGNGNQRGRADFREDVAKLYFQLADLLLRQVDAARAPDAPNSPNSPVLAAGSQPAGAKADAAQPGEATLFQARETVELLKSAELEDYLRDECVPTFKSENGGAREIESTTAVVYVIPLPDRIELLVQFGAHVRRYRTPVGEVELAKTAREFRKLLPYVASEEHRDAGRKLFRWLIGPIRDDLKSHGVDTLVFVPDGSLRTIPMAALLDEDNGQYLIEEYAIAVVPALSLTPGRPAAPEASRSTNGPQGGGAAVLLSGLSVQTAGFPALPYVPVELRDVERASHGSQQDVLLNDDFMLSTLTMRFNAEQPSVVHIASHGSFGSEAKDTFILTHDAPLTLNGLEQLIRVNNFKGRRPVSLLVLSACQTAAGDDRAALGLGGVAVKSGARSAVATLWSVNDESSAQLISDFYRQRNDHPKMPVAKAMQAAQVDMIRSPSKLVYQHPNFWAPYLMIGDWH